MSLQRIRIATRESALAMWQARHVAAELAAKHPGLTIELVPMTTRGDQVLDRSLAAIGGKGLFLKELEVAMQEGRADVAVHSLKDVPMELEPGFALAAILTRADPFDAFISNRYATLAELPQGARVGTSSLRRQVQLRRLRPDLELMDLRGNVNTRLAKLDAGQYDAIILACAGMDRLGFGERIRDRLAAPDWLPAASQGAIAIECRADDDAVRACMAVLDDADTATCVSAERAMNRRLEGSCQVPIAAFARLHASRLHLVGAVGALEPVQWLQTAISGPTGEPEALGLAVAEELLARGAHRILGKE